MIELFLTFFSSDSRWGAPTFDFLSQIWNDPASLGPDLSALSASVSLCPATNLWDNNLPISDMSSWKRTVFNYKEMSNDEVNKFRGLSSSKM
jgi:hypothetical protein